jgi:primosomal protein N' (replication factor Y) (superfamily II helicase)
MCTNCHWIPRCRNCDVSLTYHKYFDSLKCHYCSYGREVPPVCEQCGQSTMRIFGFGTEKIEEEIQIFFPTANIARLDLDTTRGKEAHRQVIDSFSNHEVDILVGTQMVTKGLDFGNVSLVGILSADQLLSYPDFRSHERAYQLMAQVSGRAGRRQKPGKVIIQANDPDNPVIRDVVNHNYLSFYERELNGRKLFNYPPLTRLIKVTLRHKDKDVVAQAAGYMTQGLKAGLRGILLGPGVPIIGRVRNYYLQEILLKLQKDNSELLYNKDVLIRSIAILKKHAGFKTLEVQVDVDP